MKVTKYTGIIFGLILAFPIVALVERNRPDDKVSRCIQKGIGYLIKSQRDGRWYDPKRRRTQAISSIAAMALLCFPDAQSEGSLRAVKKGLSYLLRKPIIRDPWNLCFSLLFLKRCLRHPRFQGSQDQIKQKIIHILEGIAETQLKDGGWDYGWDYSTGGSTSFTTAIVLLTLKEAQDAGFKTPRRVIKRGIRSLRRLRIGPGVFSYTGGKRIQRWASRKGSVGRGCVCELALFRWSSAGPGDLKKALKNFFKYRSTLVKWLKRSRKRGTHRGPYGIAPYYFFFAHHFASLVVEELGQKFKDKGEWG